VLTTKLFAPTRRPNAIARPALTERLDAALEEGHRLTLVAAPAGFGKTTLLTEWLTDAAQRHPETRVGWLSLDEGDNDLTRWVTHLVAALDRVGLEVDTVAGAVHDGPTAAMSALVNAVARTSEQPGAGHRWVLVLDDYHVVEAGDVHEAVTFLLDHLPDRLHLVVATRSDPPLPVARLRARGQLVEVRARDLRLTPPEAHEFLNGVMGLSLTAAEVGALDQRTEGWVAGLQLAALSLRGMSEPDDVAAFIEAFTGSHRFVIDYLADEVLARQPSRAREFLLRTAVLDRLTGSLCDAVTGGSDGAALLAQLDRENLFLVPLDDERGWYRYHHLFAGVLRARLVAEHPDEAAALHRRASDWHAGNGMVEDAVRHALAARDFDRAAHLMEEAVPQVRRARQDSLLQAWVRALPVPVVRRSPVLSVVSGWAELMSGDLDAVGSRLDDAEAALAAGEADETVRSAWADTEDLRTAPATIAVYRASLSQARGDVPGTVRHARRALDLARPEDHFVRGAAAGFLGLAAWAAGAVGEALSTFPEAVRSLHAAGNAVDELDSTVVLADMWLAAGRPSRARRLYEEALRAATRNGEPYPRATADLHVGLAELDRELDDLPGAEAHLEVARVLRERASITENRHRWSVALAQVRAAAGDFDTATRLLDEAEALYRHGFYPDVRPIAAMRARVWIAAGDLEAATDWAGRHRVAVDAEPDYLHEYEHLTLVRLLLARHRAGRQHDAGADASLAAALSLLDRLHATAAGTGRHGSVREILVLQALAHHASGDLLRAAEALGRSFVEPPEPDGQVRLYLDEGAPMSELLRSVADPRAGAAAGVDPPLQAAALRLLARGEATTARATGAAGPQPQQELVEPLSRRELEVLRLLDTELTGPEIARALFVTVNTLRTHTKRIFTKLDVTTRAAAVRRAHERGLL
jgi:LuxR family transcriptional regulator, maltose regulon positive regulatory protein